MRRRVRAGPAACIVVFSWIALLAIAPAAGASAPAYGDADYLAFADRIAERLEHTWSPADGYYRSGDRGLESRYNAALLLVHATAAAYGHAGAARNDERARTIARRLTESPPFIAAGAPPWPDPMFHAPGWAGNMAGDYTVMDKAIDPKVAEGLQMAWRARGALALPEETARAIAGEIGQVAQHPFFRFPAVRLNQINWPLELIAYDASVNRRPELLRTEYGLQVARFVAGIRGPWLEPLGATAPNLSPSYRFHYAPGTSPSAATNIDSAEYANMTLHFLAFYDEARRAGMPKLPAADIRLLRAWLQRTLFGDWTHAGFLNWDTGLGFRRWMKGKTWAYAQQGLIAMAGAARFHGDPRHRAWAKALFDSGLELYLRMQPAGGTPGSVPASNLFSRAPRVRQVSDDVLMAARMAANAARALSAGLGRLPGAEPPPFYAFDADIGRLAVSTPSYATAVVAVNRGAFPYGGNELARLFDGDGDPIGGIGGQPPASFGVVVRDRAGNVALASQSGRVRDPARPPVILTRSPQGPVRRLAHLPARPAAGPFGVLEAVARRRSAELEITTRHRFTARAIHERWVVRRRARRTFYSAAVQLPSWGRDASIDAELADGTVMPLAVDGLPTGSVALPRVRRFVVRSEAGSYAVALGRRARGHARAVPVAPQTSAPDPGPTLELTLREGSRFERAELNVEMIPAGR